MFDANETVTLDAGTYYSFLLHELKAGVTRQRMLTLGKSVRGTRFGEMIVMAANFDDATQTFRIEDDGLALLRKVMFDLD